MVGGFKTKLQLYTVPGQVFYNSTRKLVLKGVDGIVFVVDSQSAMLDACRESYQNLEENLRELGLILGEIPTVFQWNKRDLKNVVSIDQLEATFNPRGLPSFQSVASDGTGVFETLRGITKLALGHIKSHVLEEGAAAPPVLPVRAASIEPLTLSDLPSVSDLLDLEGATAGPAPTPALAPLPDGDDDMGFLIEAPILPEPPEPTLEAFAFPGEDEGLPPVASELEGAPAPTSEFSFIGDLEPLTALHEGQDQEVTHEEALSLMVGLPIPDLALDLSPQAATEPPSAAPPRPKAKVDPLAGLASLHLETRKPVLKAKHSDAQTISSLLGELTLAGRSGAPSVLRLEVPPELDGQELEVVVQLRHKGQILVEGQIHRPAPAKGSTAKLSVEMKRT
jgi:hypothetical protein